MTSTPGISHTAHLESLLAGEGVVLMIGLGITGIETALFLQRCGIAVRCVERSTEEEYQAKSRYADRIDELREVQIPVAFGIDGEAVLAFTDKVSLVVLSPGVSLESAIVGTIRRLKIRTVTELELGLELAGIPAVMVTGSNGKSTTVSLIHELLTAGGIPNLLCGNVGTPILTELSLEDLKRGRSDRYQYLVVEASSYQLEASQQVKPKIGVFLNLSDNHLERHGSMARYLEAKAKMLANQDHGDFAVLNGDDAYVRSVMPRCNAVVALFGVSPGAPFAATIAYEPERGIDTITFCRTGAEPERYECLGARLMGLHNRYDMAAAIVAARLVGVAPTVIQSVLLTFNPLEHRLERCGERGGILRINDSKSTTVAATVAALTATWQSAPDRPVTLLIGGLVKAGSWDPLMKLIKQNPSKIREVVCFGKDRAILSDHCAAYDINHRDVPTLREAIPVAEGVSQEGDIILLSPGCASFDEFKSFEERGELFRRLMVSDRSVASRYRG